MIVGNRTRNSSRNYTRSYLYGTTTKRWGLWVDTVIPGGRRPGGRTPLQAFPPALLRSKGRIPSLPFVLRFDPVDIPWRMAHLIGTPPLGASSVIAFEESNPGRECPLAAMIPLYHAAFFF